MKLTQNDILEYIEKQYSQIRAGGYPLRENGEGITRKEYAMKTGVSPDTARRVLDALVRTGKMRMEKMYDPDKHTVVNVYFVVESDQHKPEGGNR